MSATFIDHPEMYRFLLESLPIGACILDRERRVRFWNRSAEHRASGEATAEATRG